MRQTRKQKRRKPPAKRKARSKPNPALLTVTNPATELAAAKAAYKRFHGVDCQATQDLGPGTPNLIALGDLVDISYRPTRGQRKGAAYLHKFGRGAKLAATVDRRHLYLIPAKGRPFRMDWERGIIG